MVEDQITDGYRIAELLASEVEGRSDGDLARLTVTNAVPDVEPSEEGTRAYDIHRDDADFAAVYVHRKRLRLEFITGARAAVEAADHRGLTTKPSPDSSQPTIVLKNGAEIKRAVATVESVSKRLE